jgi:Rrf2 family protein
VKLITRDTDYALRALCFIAASHGRRIAVSDLVKALKIPRPFLRKILQRLHKKGILYSYRGLGGGFLLKGSTNQVFLLDLINIFQGPFKLNECFFKGKLCPNTKKCVLKEKMDRIEKHVLKELKGVSIAYLLRQR